MEQKPSMEKAKSDLVWSVRKVLTFSADCHLFCHFLKIVCAKIVLKTPEIF